LLNRPPDGDELLIEAARAYGATIKHAMRAGGQKLVALVDYEAGTAVLKVARIDQSATDEALKRAHREATLLATISHPNIVKGLTAAVELGRPPHAIAWLEEFLDGQDLRDIVGTPWSWQETSRMALDIASALGALHANQVVHRDLSAGNVRRLTSGVYKVLDPGLARHLNLSAITGLHQPGTPGFLSPEHVQLGLTPSYASDVFVLGILMWLALTGHLPISPSDPNEYINRLASGQIPSIAAFRPDLQPNQVAVVDRCLQRQVARRYFDGLEVRAALEGI